MVTSGCITLVILLVEVIAYAVYVRGVLRGEIVLSRASWLIWAPLLWLTVASAWEGGAGLAIAKLVASAVGVSLIAVLALRLGTGGWSRCDRLCFTMTLIGVVGWATSADPVVGLALFILADAVGAVPTVRDVLREPARERPAYWLLCSLSCVMTLALVSEPGQSLSARGFAEWGYALYVVLLNAVVLTALVTGRVRVRQVALSARR